MIKVDKCTGLADIDQILALQQENLAKSLSPEEIKSQGFVTVVHDQELLNEMNFPYPHVVARDRNSIIGYALTMLPEFEKRVPILVPMFEQINSVLYQGKLLKNQHYCVMGQICIKKDYRGQGLFETLYKHFKEALSPHYSYVVTEVAKRNTRSAKAHEKIGFKIISEYKSYEDGEEWIIYLWDWA